MWTILQNDDNSDQGCNGNSLYTSLAIYYLVTQGRKHHCSECHRNFVCDSQQCLLEVVYPCCNCDYNNQHMVSEYVNDPIPDTILCKCKEKK